MILDDRDTIDPTPRKLEARRKPSAPAERALAEARARRALEASRTTRVQKEVGGRGGPEPVRYGDWERNGLASDF